MSLFIGPRWLRFRLGRRGTRVSVGPRLFRLHGGAGRPRLEHGRWPVHLVCPAAAQAEAAVSTGKPRQIRAGGQPSS